MKRIIRLINVIAIVLIICFGAKTVRAPASLGGGVGLGKGNAAARGMDSAYTEKTFASEAGNNGQKIGADGDGGDNSSHNDSSSYGSFCAGSMRRKYGQNSSELEAEQGEQANTAVAENPPYNKYYMTYEEMMAIGNIDLWDKITGMAILSKLGKEDAEKLLDLASGGITMNEFETASRLLEEALSREDFEKLIDITEKNKILYADNMND